MLLVMQENPLGTFIKTRRQQLGFASQRELATKAGVSHGYIANLERGYDYNTGKRVNPSIEKMEQIARVLRVTPEQLSAIGRGLDPVAVLAGQVTTEQPTAKGPKDSKPWSRHDFSQSSGVERGTGADVKTGNELSKSGQHTDDVEALPGTLDTRIGDAGHALSILTDFGTVKKLPVYRVSCGERVLINDDPQEWQTWPVVWTGPVDGIMIVEGESMLGCGYKPGDQLFFQLINGHRPKSGDKVIAEVDGGAVCKLYQRDEAGEYLLSAPGDPDATPYMRRVTDAVRLVGIVKKRLTDG